MIKRVMIRLCGYLSGVSVCALHILFCSRLFGWVATLVIVGVQLGIAGWVVYTRIRRPAFNLFNFKTPRFVRWTMYH